jgi:hypothetical protein
MSKASLFGKRMARALLETSSSHAYFFVQQAHKGKRWGKDGELMGWEDVVKILKEVISEKGRGL